MRKIFKLFITIIIILIIGLFVVGSIYYLYNYFNKNNNGIVISGPLSINYSDGYNLRVKGNMTTTIKIINDSDQEAYYFVEFKNVRNIIGSAEYTLTNNDDIYIKETLNEYDTVVSSYIHLGGKETEELKLSFKSPEVFAFKLTINISVENLEDVYFGDVLLKNNDIKDAPLTKVGKEVAVENEGLIEASDDFGTTYYFRGNVDNNYVKIKNDLYRIVKINGDGTVKLVLDGAIPTFGAFSSNPKVEEFVDSNAYNLIASWFNDTLSDYQEYISTQKYCNDVIKDKNSYNAYVRIHADNIITYSCVADRFTGKFGLLTADEVIYAGATLDSDNKSFYLYHQNLGGEYLTMTGGVFYSDVYHPFAVNATGKLITTIASTSIKPIRPVITLIKDVKVTGTGTINDPYVLTINK